MANISEFCLTVSGPQDDVDRLRHLILSDTEPIPEGAYSDEFVFSLKSETWGNLDGSQEFLWLTGIGQYTGQTVLGDHPVRGELRIFGESKWAPPLVFAECVLERFPGVDVDIKSETEHELFEHWNNGYGQRHLMCRHEQLTDPKEGTILRLVIDGHQVLPYGAEDPNGEVVSPDSALPGWWRLVNGASPADEAVKADHQCCPLANPVLPTAVDLVGAQFRDLANDELEELGRFQAEEEAIDLQCLADGHSDRDLAVVMREVFHVQREVYQILRAESRRRSAPLTFDEAVQVVKDHIPYAVEKDIVFSAFEMLRDDSMAE
jgi:hypothetical protein